MKKGVDVASPYVKAGANLAQEVAKPVIKAAGPIVQVMHHQHSCEKILLVYILLVRVSKRTGTAAVIHPI